MNDTDHVIELEDLTKRFRRQEAVNGVTLSLPRGCILGLLGPNGAGKTTTIRLMVDILRPNSGEARLFGVPSTRLGRKEFERIGYVSENQKMPLWMTVQQLLDYCRPMYPTWDDKFAKSLVDQFELPLNQKLKHLSRGFLMKAALVSSLAYRPELLILDEPFSGLDPVSREDFIDGILELTNAASWSVFISSHDIDDVEKLTDRVALIDRGTIKVDEDSDRLRNRHRRMSLDMPEDPVLPSNLPETWVTLRVSGRRIEFVETQYEEGRTEEQVRQHWPQASHIESAPMTLKQIYLSTVRASKFKQAA